MTLGVGGQTESEVRGHTDLRVVKTRHPFSNPSNAHVWPTQNDIALLGYPTQKTYSDLVNLMLLYFAKSAKG